jgi:hypothetical protein
MNKFKKIATRCCLECGYLMAQEEINLLKVVVDCPNECGTTINDFQIVEYENKRQSNSKKFIPNSENVS